MNPPLKVIFSMADVTATLGKEASRRLGCPFDRQRTVIATVVEDGKLARIEVEVSDAASTPDSTPEPTTP